MPYPENILQPPDMQPVMGPQAPPPDPLAAVQGLIEAMQQAGQGPLFPTPEARFSAGLTGLGAGLQGQPNPAVTQALAQRQQDISMLEAQMRNRMALEGLRIKVQEMAEKRETATRDLAKTLVSGISPIGRKMGAGIIADGLRKAGQVIPPGFEDSFIETKHEDLQDIARLASSGATPALIQYAKPHVPKEVIEGLMGRPPEFYESFGVKPPGRSALESAKAALEVAKLAKEVEAQVNLPAHVQIDTLVQELQQARQAYGPQHPVVQALEERLDALKPVAVPEGGGVFGIGSRAPILQGLPKTAGPGEREKIAETNAIIGLGQTLIHRWETTPTLKPGGAARLQERELVLGLRLSDLMGPAMTPEQRKFMADVGIFIGTYRRAYSGLAVTAPEMLMSAPVVPSDAGAITMEQLKAITEWSRENRTSLDQVLEGARLLPGPLPPPPPPGPSPLARRLHIRDKKTGRTGETVLPPGRVLPPGLEELVEAGP